MWWELELFRNRNYELPEEADWDADQGWDQCGQGESEVVADSNRKRHLGAAYSRKAGDLVDPSQEDTQDIDVASALGTEKYIEDQHGILRKPPRYLPKNALVYLFPGLREDYESEHSQFSEDCSCEEPQDDERKRSPNHSPVPEDIDKGYLEEIASLSHAQQRWGDRVAVGRMNVAQAPGKAPRLIVDSSVCGTNGACYVPESYQLPLLESIRFSSPLRECSSVIGGFSLDIRAAHKTVRVRERDRGLLGVGLQNGDSYCFFFYKVCPFGATFSSHWFQRVSGFLVRFLHVLIWVRHMLMMYSDDLLMAQDEAVLPLMASLVLAACAAFGYPISWKKLQLGPTVTWIGWELHFASGSFCIPQDKLLRLEEMLQTLLRERHVKKKDFEKVIGVIQWMLQCHPILRPFLTPLYLDLNRPLGTLFSVNPGDWRSFCACVDEHAIFSSVPRGMAFSPGSRLLEARHAPISCSKDLLKAPVTSKRLWVRIADLSTSRRKLSKASVLFLQFWKQLSSGPPRLRALRHPPAWDVEAAADAHGSGPHLGIGGYFRVGAGPCFWFSEQWTVEDFAFTRLELQSDAQRNICCYEALGQIALVHC